MFNFRPVNNNYGVFNQFEAFNFLESTNHKSKGEKIDLTELNDLVAKRKFGQIINNENLFYLAWCKAFSAEKHEDTSNFQISTIDNKTIAIYNPMAVGFRTKKMIEKIRPFFVNGLQNHQDFNILLAEPCGDYYFVADTEKIDITDRGLNGDAYKCMFDKYIIPGLPGLAKSCGSNYATFKKTMQAKLYSSSPNHIETKEVQVIRIEWKKNLHLIYPITPKALRKAQDLGEGLYNLYQQQQCCDLRLICKEGVIQIHSAMLHISGDLTFQKLLTASMKETQEKSITFPVHTLETIKAFADFIYLGDRAFQEKLLSADQEMDLFEMLDFGFTYQVNTFIDCLTNVISIYATEKDFKIIQEFADKYNNDHLKELCKKMAQDFLKSLPKQDSSSMIKSFAEFIYMSNEIEAPVKVLLAGTDIDLFKVVCFAEAYEVLPLMECCQELILNATLDDIEA